MNLEESIISATMTASGLQINMTSVAGYLYTAQYSTNPALPWTQLQTTVTGTGGIITVTDPNPTNTSRFYVGILTGIAP
jgi:recombinational DNA repair protein RecT